MANQQYDVGITINVQVWYPGTRQRYIRRFKQFYSSHKLFDAPNAGCISFFSHYGMKEILTSKMNIQKKQTNKGTGYLVMRN